MQRTGDLVQHQDGGIADAVLEIGEVTLGHPGGLRNGLAREAAGARASRTRSPSAARKGFFSSSAASGAGRGSGVDATRNPASVRSSSWMHYSA